jgi:acetylornithine/succinyldiaminopimelate/putrescine aminotransferase
VHRAQKQSFPVEVAQGGMKFVRGRGLMVGIQIFPGIHQIYTIVNCYITKVRLLMLLAEKSVAFVV